MIDYWLDSGGYIETAKGGYAFDIAPGYWTFIEHLARRDRLSSPMEVYRELIGGHEYLVDWIEQRKDTFFMYPEEDVYDAFTAVADHVAYTYNPPQAARFLDVADPWLIAHARAGGGAVVTLEVRAGRGSPMAKIPNVCEALGVRWMSVYDMLRKEGVSFHWRP